MKPLPSDQWQTALEHMDAALQTAARALDRAEDRWERALAPSAGEGEPPPALARLDARLGGWEERLEAARAAAAAAEREFAERSETVDLWRALFARWQQLLQREQ
jgi:hypothetical protein